MRIRSQLVATSAALAAGVLAGPAMAYTSQDLRSPDAIDAAAAVQTAAGQDKRSPDAADPVRATPPAVVVEPSSGFDWGSAAIGAGGAIGLVAVTTGGGLALRRRHTMAGISVAER